MLRKEYQRLKRFPEMKKTDIASAVTPQ